MSIEAIKNSTDVVVAGSGIGGITAALSAQEKGANVIVLEKADQTGGSAAVSGGTVWCARDLDTWLRVQPGGDPALGEALIINYREGIDWLKDQGVELEDKTEMTPYKFPAILYQFLPDSRTAMDYLAGIFMERGGTILTKTSLRKLIQDKEGEVCGAIALGAKGFVEIAAAAVVLATGGFQASPELRGRYLGRWADRVIVRGNPHSSGDGFLAALEVGAGSAGPFSRFYGHLVPAAPAVVDLSNFVSVKPDFAEYTILVNLNGERFEDEFLGDEVVVHALVHQPQATAILIFDEEIRLKRAAPPPSSAPSADRINCIRDAGGEILEAETLEALANLIAGKWKVNRGRFLETISSYNEACRSGGSSSLFPTKSGGLETITTPPFYAIRFLPGATFTYGGARVNERAEVLDSSDGLIKGLYAAGADAGGVYTLGYTGGLSLGLAFGRLAGKGAAATAARN